MASWNGSYYGSENPNYYSYPDQSNAGSSAQTWNYYLENAGNTVSQNRPNVYSQNGSGILNQNGTNVFHQIGINVPSVSSNAVSVATAHCELQVPPIANNVNPQWFFDNNGIQQQLPSFNCKTGNYNRGNKKNNVSSKTSFYGRTKNVNPSLIEFSNLHATAGEFIPNSVKSGQGNISAVTAINKGDSSSRVENVQPQIENSALESGPSKIFYADNKGRYNERRYDNKRNPDYRQRELQENQYQNGSSYRNSYKNQNPKSHGKFQNDKYTSNKRYPDNNKYYSGARDLDRKKLVGDSFAFSNTSSDVFRSNSTNSMQFVEEDKQFVNEKLSKNGIKDSTYDDTGDANKTSKYYTGSTNESSLSSHNLDLEHSQSLLKKTKRYFSDDRTDRYRDRRDQRGDRYETNHRDKKSNYQDYNGYRGNYDREDKSERARDKDKNKDSGREYRDREIENWRHKSENSSKGATPKRSSNKRHDTDDDASQRERLTDQLNRGKLECLVCCEYIKQNDHVWSCSNCYHVLHLKCIKKWAKSSQGETGWRCPACQNVTTNIPEDYYCFCGRAKVPEWNRRDVAHSCGDVCGRMRFKTNCVHKCNLLCHPGPCPVCTAMILKYCACGRTSQTLQCSTETLLLCDAICEKMLNCEKHTCEKKCHHGNCEPCEKVVHQECHCGKYNREVTCVANVSSTYSCENVCDKLLDCKNHKCKAQCHSGSCEPCSLKPELVTHCCCGQTPLIEQRKSCLDEIPTCDKLCCKRLKCGQPSNPHVCKVKCHQDECPECELTTKVKCRCGNMDKEIPCKELTTKADDARCLKRCTKKRSCGKHKCNQLCCIDIEHVCLLPCSKTLSCGRHRCEQTCHKSRCQPCWRSSFDELYCECGTAVIYPPVPCGTRRPKCDKPCTRQHVCTHEVLHNCHSEPTCPPCTVLTQKWCYGKHELRKAVPCHVNEISCGLSCNKPISCGRHKCIMMCHSGPCEKSGQLCVQPCNTPRELCGHICAAPCHEGKCPDVPCKEMVKVTCQCGHRSMTRACSENSREFQRIASGILASKMAEMQLGHSVDLEEVFGQGARKQNQLKTLECNDECKIMERNRRLALGLQIVNPDLSGKLMPRYSDFMKQWAKKDPHFCQMVHEKLTELVQLAKTSKQKSRSYSFESMNRDKRHFVHEYCEQFGCESQAYDQEPKRNVVATAVKDKCWLPSLSLLEIIQRENGQRKVPRPMLNSSKTTSSLRNVEVLPLAKKSHKVLSAPSTSKSPEPEIDYFDFHG